jgi:hypothetical protein
MRWIPVFREFDYPSSMPPRFLSACLILAASASGQVILHPDSRGKPLSVDTLTYSYSAPEAMFGQSIGATQVVSGNAKGAGFVNPALLGEPRARWAGGQASWGYSSLFPEFNLPELWESHREAIYQGCGIGLSLKWKSHHFGAFPTDTTRNSGTIDFSGNTYGLSAGWPLAEKENAAHFLGAAAAWVSAPAIFAEKKLPSQGFLADLGYLGVFAKTIRVGISAQNLGLPVRGLRPAFLRERYGAVVRTYRKLFEEEDFLLTPPRFHGGAAVRHEWKGASLPILETDVSAAYTLEFRKEGFRDPHGFQSYELNWLLLHTVHTEYGILLPAEKPLLFKWGFGLDLFNHLLVQFARLDSSGLGWDNQRSFALTLHHLLAWKRSDWTWWRR